MLGTSTVVALVAGLVLDIATILGAVIVSVMGIALSLLAIGWFWRFLKRHVTGRKI